MRAFSIGLALLALAWAAPASAQITIVLEDLNGRGMVTQAAAATAFSTTTGRPIGATECEENDTMTFTLSNFGTTGVIAIWRGASASAMCETGTSRNMTATGAALCTQIGSGTAVVAGAPLQIQVGVRDLFGADQCSGVATATPVFWFLNVDSAGDVTTNVPAASFGTFALTLDSLAPGAPTISGSPAGDDPIPVSVSPVSADVTMIGGADVYVDMAGSGCPDAPTSTTLVPGAAPTVSSVGSSSPGTEVAVSASALGLTGFGSYAVIAATVTDNAGNVSPLSALGCVQRVQVRGFWDEYCAERGYDPSDAAMLQACTDAYAGCAASPRGGAAVPWMILAAGALGLLAARRRR